MKLKDKKKHLIIVNVIAVIVAIVSLCSVVLFGNKDKDVVELPELSGGGQTAETSREIVIEDTTFTSGSFTVQSGSNVTIRNCTFTGITTGAIYVKTDATLNLEGCTFEDNIKAQGGGAALHIVQATVNINNCIFDNNQSSTGYDAGAIFANDTTINISNSSFVNNVANDDGGALLINGSSTAQILGGVTFDNCRAPNGGAIFVGVTSKLTIQGDNVIKNCSSTYGGGIYINGDLIIDAGEISGNTATTYGGGVYVSSSATYTMREGSIFDNTAKHGGGIYSNGNTTISGCNITGNTGTNGGGVYIYSGTYNLNGGYISENEATNYGGGIYNNNTGIVKISDSTKIKKNSAESGGGIYNDGKSLELSNSHIEENTAITAGGGIFNSATLNISNYSLIKSNTAKNGGGIASEAGAISIKHTDIWFNEATNIGGGIHTVTSTSSTFELNNSELYNNRAYRGGGIYHAANFEFYITGYTVIASNKASNHGGGIYVNKGSVYLGSSDLQFTGEIGGNSADAYGGAIFSYGNVYQYGGCIGPGADCASGNTASIGGGVHIRSGEYVMYGGRIEGNTSTKQGGGIYAGATGVLTISGGTVLKNTSSTNGGGICHESSGGFVISGTADIVGNSASSLGGGVYVGAGTLSIGTDEVPHIGTITGNQATNGGGIYVTNATLNQSTGTIGGECTVGNTTYTGNTATNGGGVFVDASGTCNLNGGNVSQNSASSGGGVYVTTSATLSVNGCEISANSGTEGGGIFGTGATISLTSATISNNTAQNGGGVFVNKSSVLAVNSSTISSNTIGSTSGVVYGAGIYSYGCKLSVGGNTTISNNGKSALADYDPSTIYGGGIYSAGAASFVISGAGVQISSNNAHRGAGVMVSGQYSQISDCVILNNTSSNLGGGFYAAGGNTTFAGVVVAGNTSGYGGGGVHLHRANFEFTNTKINENFALSHAAGIGTSSASIVMNDGSEVKGNKINPTIEEESFSGRGAGVLVYGGTMAMNGGIISDNEVHENCKRRLGAGLYVSDGGHVTMNGGTISNNKFLGDVSTPSYGANVYVKSEADTVNSNGTFTILDATFVMNGGTISGDGTAQATLGTGIFSSSVVDINGGEILNCVAENAGGAIAHFGTSFSIGGVTISGCSAPLGEAIISGDKIVVDGEFSGVSGTIALGTSELYGVVSNDELLDEGSFVNPMRTASIFENFKTAKAYTYQIEFFAYVQSFDAGIDNCVYDLMDDESHMKAFYLEDFSESGYTTHTDYYLLKFTTNNIGRTCEMVSSEEDYSFKLYEEVEANTDGYRLNPYKTFTVKVYYYDENYDYQFVEWEVVEGTNLREGEYINQLGYYDENGDFVYVETCEDMIEHNGTIFSYWETEDGEIFYDAEIESDMVIVPIYEVSYCYVTVYYYDENYDYQFVEWEVVEGTNLREGEYINQLGYYDENGDFVYVETCEDMIEHNGTIFSYWETEDGEIIYDADVESDMVIVPFYEVSYCYVTVYYYDENDEYQSVELEIVEGASIDLYANQIDYYDENDNWGYIITKYFHDTAFVFDGWKLDSDGDGIVEIHGEESIKVWWNIEITPNYVYEDSREPDEDDGHECWLSVAIVGANYNSEYLDVTGYEEDFMISDNCYEEIYMTGDTIEITIEIFRGDYSDYFVFFNGLEIFCFKGSNTYIVTNYNFRVNGVLLTNTGSSYSYSNTTTLTGNIEIVIEVYIENGY